MCNTTCQSTVLIYGTLKEIAVAYYTALNMDNYLCSAKLHTRDISCINATSNCLFKSNNFNKIFYNYNRLRYSIISNVSCKMSNAGVILKINSVNDFYYVPLNISEFARCDENFMLALKQREFIYEFNFEINVLSYNLNLIYFSVRSGI